MCITNASAIGNILEFAASAFTNINSVVTNVNESKYRSQVAINNAKTAENEARRIQQLGIQEARSEKIAGIRNANLIAAKNASSGLDIYGTTSSYQYLDAINEANSNAKNILDSYDYKAQSYFDKANDYAENARLSIKNANNYLLNTAAVSLGQFGSVAKKWDSNDIYKMKDEGYELF